MRWRDEGGRFRSVMFICTLSGGRQAPPRGSRHGRGACYSEEQSGGLRDRRMLRATVEKGRRQKRAEVVRAQAGAVKHGSSCSDRPCPSTSLRAPQARSRGGAAGRVALRRCSGPSRAKSRDGGRRRASSTTARCSTTRRRSASVRAADRRAGLTTSPQVCPHVVCAIASRALGTTCAADAWHTRVTPRPVRRSAALCVGAGIASSG